MEARTARLKSDDGRWLELRVEGSRATARVGDAAPFPFVFENLVYVANGLGYQAWGESGYFAFRRVSEGVAVEFQGPNDRRPAVRRLDAEELRATLDLLNALAPVGSRAAAF